MEIKVFYDPISPTGEVLNREEVLNSRHARKAAMDCEFDRAEAGLPAQAISAAMIFDKLIKCGIIKELRPRNKVRVSKLPLTDIQNFSPNFFKGAQDEGWAELNGGKLTIHGFDGEVVFNVLQQPGRYCLHCGNMLSANQDDITGAAARAHVAEKHAGKTSPDQNNPAGYVAQNYYKCQLEVDHG